MLDWTEIKSMVDGLVDEITVTDEGLSEAKERSANFLVGQAVLTSHLKEVSGELAKLATARDATYAHSLSKVTGENITQKKINVANETEYTALREQYEELEAKREWLKNFIKIFENAHILYRSFSREGG